MFKSIFKAVAVSAVAAFFSIGCGGGDGGNTAGPSGDGGGLTVTGLPSSGGSWSANVYVAGTDISTENVAFTVAVLEKRIAVGVTRGGGNIFPLFTTTMTPSVWEGSGNLPVLLARGDTYLYATVSFSNGVGTIPFSSFTPVSGTGGGDPVDPNDPNTGGGSKLTVTRLPSGSWTATVHAAGTDISYGLAISNNSIAKGGVTANIGNVFTLYRANETPSPSTYWTGSGSLPVSLLDGSGKDAADGIYFRRATVTFSNGNATVSFNSFTPVTDLSGSGNPVDPNDPNTGGGGRSQLTITGLPSGSYQVGVFPVGTNASDFAYDDEDIQAIGDGQGSNVFNLVDYNASEQAGSFVYFKGSGNREVLLRSYQVRPVEYWRATVNFSNGNATVPFSSFTLLEDDDDDDPPDNPGNGGGGDPSESWPSGDMLSEFGIGGLTMPLGTTDVEWFKMSDARVKGLIITATTTANFSYFENYFESNVWTFVQEMSSSTVTVKVWQKSSQSQTLQAQCSKNSSDNSLTLVVSIEYNPNYDDD